MYCQFLKRIFDFFAAIFLLLLLIPFLFIIALLVRIYLGSPIIFQQWRPGKNEKIFRLYKFRTMKEARDKDGHLLEDAMRLTRFGRLLRKLSLDELPALINVLKGEMSFVGPRPLLIEYLPYYSDTQKKRHSLQPGITGWAQVNGRNNLSWKKKFELDIWYVDHCSFMLDCKIVLLTFVKIIQREGISAKGQATMTRFDLEMKQLNKMD